MSRRADELRFRREALLRTVTLQRLDLGDHLQHLWGGLDGVDRGLSVVRRLATPPVLVAGGLLIAMLLGRGGARRVLAGGLAMSGLFLRAGSAGRALAHLARGQFVRRSR